MMRTTLEQHNFEEVAAVETVAFLGRRQIDVLADCGNELGSVQGAVGVEDPAGHGRMSGRASCFLLVEIWIIPLPDNFGKMIKNNLHESLIADKPAVVEEWRFESRLWIRK